MELATKAYGDGRFIYDAELQPLLGDTGYSSSTFAYAIYRNAVEWAFEAAGMPIVKVSPWQYPYDAAGMVRHDFEASLIRVRPSGTPPSTSRVLGMKGDYYFTTGTLRISPTNPDTRMSDAQKRADIDNLRTAVSSYGATVGSHNGGLTNPPAPDSHNGHQCPLPLALGTRLRHWTSARPAIRVATPTPRSLLQDLLPGHRDVDELEPLRGCLGPAAARQRSGGMWCGGHLPAHVRQPLPQRGS